MKRKGTKYPNSYISASYSDTSSNNWNEPVSFGENWIEFADSDDPEVIRECMEDNGYGVTSTLGEACQVIYDCCDDLEQALHQIDIDYGNCTGVFPLCDYDWREQQDIYLDWMLEFHPDEIPEDFEFRGWGNH